MIFNIDYASDITFVTCHEYQTTAIITYEASTNLHGVVQTYGHYNPMVFEHPDDALAFACEQMYAHIYFYEDDVEYFTKEEMGDKEGFYSGHRSEAKTVRRGGLTHTVR